MDSKMDAPTLENCKATKEESMDVVER